MWRENRGRPVLQRNANGRPPPLHERPRSAELRRPYPGRPRSAGRLLDQVTAVLQRGEVPAFAFHARCRRLGYRLRSVLMPVKEQGREELASDRRSPFRMEGDSSSNFPIARPKSATPRPTTDSEGNPPLRHRLLLPRRACSSPFLLDTTAKRLQRLNVSRRILPQHPTPIVRPRLWPRWVKQTITLDGQAGELPELGKRPPLSLERPA